MTTQQSTAQQQIRFADEVAVGDIMPSHRHGPTEVQLFRYCATTWNAHRIHYDTAYAQTEGYPNILVQSHLHGAFLTSLCDEWRGAYGELRRLKYSVRRFACPGDVLDCQGTVTALDDSEEGGLRVTLELKEVREADGVECAIGDAEVFLPFRASVPDEKETH